MHSSSDILTFEVIPSHTHTNFHQQEAREQRKKMAGPGEQPPDGSGRAGRELERVLQDVMALYSSPDNEVKRQVRVLTDKTKT